MQFSVRRQCQFQFNFMRPCQLDGEPATKVSMSYIIHRLSPNMRICSKFHEVRILFAIASVIKCPIRHKISRSNLTTLCELHYSRIVKTAFPNFSIPLDQ